MTDQREPTAYERGQKQGETDRTLVDYGEHLQRINGSQAKTAELLAKLSADFTELKMALQGMRDEMVSAQKTVVATAKALEQAEDARRRADEQKRSVSDRRWTPIQRILAVVGGMVALASFVLVVVAAINV